MISSSGWPFSHTSKGWKDGGSILIFGRVRGDRIFPSVWVALTAVWMLSGRRVSRHIANENQHASIAAQDVDPFGQLGDDLLRHAVARETTVQSRPRTGTFFPPLPRFSAYSRSQVISQSCVRPMAE